jgi:hypothetical protein
MRKLFTASFSRISAAERGVFLCIHKAPMSDTLGVEALFMIQSSIKPGCESFFSRFKILSAPVDSASHRPSALAQNPLAALYLLERQSICCQGIYGLLILSNNSD